MYLCLSRTAFSSFPSPDIIAARSSRVGAGPADSFEIQFAKIELPATSRGPGLTFLLAGPFASCHESEFFSPSGFPAVTSKARDGFKKKTKCPYTGDSPLSFQLGSFSGSRKFSSAGNLGNFLGRLQAEPTATSTTNTTASDGRRQLSVTKERGRQRGSSKRCPNNSLLTRPWASGQGVTTLHVHDDPLTGGSCRHRS